MMTKRKMKMMTHHNCTLLRLYNLKTLCLDVTIDNINIILLVKQINFVENVKTKIYF